MQALNKRQPKIPARLFHDFEPKGALYAIAVKCHDIKTARDLRKIDWANAQKKREVSECVDLRFFQTNLHRQQRVVT